MRGDFMKLVWFFSSLAIMLFLAYIAILYSTYTPDAEYIQQFEQVFFLSTSIVTCAIAIIIYQLPFSHWVHRYRPSWTLYSVVIVAILEALFIIG